MEFKFFASRCCRKFGGLALGVTYQFPFCVEEITGISLTVRRFCSVLTIGLIFWKLHFEFVHTRRYEW